jgi:hypothetical protein
MQRNTTEALAATGRSQQVEEGCVREGGAFAHSLIGGLGRATHGRKVARRHRRLTRHSSGCRCFKAIAHGGAREGVWHHSSKV